MKVSPLDQKMMDNMINGIPPKMTDQQKRSVDKIYYSFLENMYSKRSKSKVEDDQDNFTVEKVAKRAAKQRAEIDKIVYRMELLDKRFHRKMKNLTKNNSPKKQSQRSQSKLVAGSSASRLQGASSSQNMISSHQMSGSFGSLQQNLSKEHLSKMN